MEALILVATLGGPTMFAPHRHHEGLEPRYCEMKKPHMQFLLHAGQSSAYTLEAPANGAADHMLDRHILRGVSNIDHCCSKKKPPA